MERRTKVIAIANQKGGVGKTTTVVNLAAALSARKRTVLVVDLDPQAHATLGLGLEKQQGVSLYPVLLGEKPIEDVIQPTKWNNLNVIPSEVDLAGAELEFGAREDRLEMIRNVLAPVREAGAFDYIILDCPPSLGIVMTSALVATDSVLIPIQAEFLAMDGLALITSSIDRLKRGMNPNLELNGIVFTMVNSQTRLTQDVIAEVQQHFGEKVYEPVVEEGQADVIIAFERLEALRYAHFLKNDGVLNEEEFELDDEDDFDDYDEEDYEDEGFDFGDEETTIYEVKCACGNVIAFDEDTLEEGSIVCDECGETLEFTFEDDED